jgi:hypothetical protein
MSAEHWILGAGAAFALALVGIAMVPDDLWDGDVSGSAAVPADAGEAGTGIAGPAPAWGRNAAMPGLIPFTRASSQRYRGRVVRTVSRGSEIGWGQVHILVDDGSGPSQEVSLAPEWYLRYLGCSITDNARVRGLAFKFDETRPDVDLYAKTITVNGKTCRLRNDEGFALWSNRLR